MTSPTCSSCNRSMLMVRIGLTIGWHCDHCVQSHVKTSCQALRVKEPRVIHNPAAIAAFHALDRDALAAAYTETTTVGELAMAYGISDSVVSRQLRKFGLNRPPKNKTSKVRGLDELLTLTHLELKQRFIASTISAMARQYNVPNGVVSRLLDVRGVTRRSKIGGRRYRVGSPQELAFLLRRSA